MGREIRMVPPNWDHPMGDDPADRHSYGRRQPMHKGTYAEARAEWLEGLRKWEAGEDPDREKYKNDDGTYMDYWEWSGAPPERAYYQPWADADATWFQLWETVSEGTPITPPFATAEELVQHLVEHGDEWDGKWNIDSARAFVKAGWAPSFVATSGKLIDSRDVPLAMEKEIR